MIYISDSTIEQCMHEDIPYLDLTTEMLGIGSKPAVIDFYTRSDGVLCGSEEVTRIFAKLGIVPSHIKPTGSAIVKNDVVMRGEGSAGAIHAAWKVSLNIFEYCSGIASATRLLVETVKKINPDMEILTTRKSFPGTKEFVIKAIVAGGALPHRLGLSESILIFKEHLTFCGDISHVIQNLDRLKKRNPEKKIVVECEMLEDAQLLAKSGVDVIQFDKVTPAKLAVYVREVKNINHNCILLAAGGVTIDNCALYAQSGVNGIVTSSLYNARQLDMGVKIYPVK
jgi:molybdenum transport protein